MILVAYSSVDTAGTNIANQFLSLSAFEKTDEEFQENPVYTTYVNGKHVKLIVLKDETIYAQTLPQHFPDIELLVCLSRHKSESGKPTLTVHTTGNFGNADLGGLPRRLSICPATAMQTALKALTKLKAELNLAYEVSYECTHHGPSLNVPTMFVELGSSPPQWSDTKAAGAVANAAMEAINNIEATKRTAVLGIGGPHYNQSFTKMALNDEAVFGHMIPKYALPQVDAEILRQCVERTLEKVTCAILDWKGIKSEDKPRVLKALAEMDFPYQKL
jgi:D-aminoacyl-tRNA deacylase